MKAFRIVAAVAVVLGLSSPAFAQNAGGQTCIVDLQRALNEVNEGQTARRTLEAEFERRQNELNAQQTELEQWLEELEASLPMLTEEARAQRMQEYQQRMMTLQSAFASHQNELAEAEAAATERIFMRMLEIVQAYARENGCALVLEKSSVLYAADTQMEFTDALVERYNAAH
jgi:outer membrane protein